MSDTIHDKTGNSCSVGTYISSVYVLSSEFSPEVYSNFYTPYWSILLIEQDGYGTNDWWGANEDSSCSRLPSGCLLSGSGTYPFAVSQGLTTYQMDATTSGNRTAIAYRLSQDILNQQAWDGGITNVMTDDWALGNATTGESASTYIAYETAITTALNDDGLTHILNCGLTPGAAENTGGMPGWTDWHNIINHCDGLVFEHPCDPDIVTTSAAVTRLIGFYEACSLEDVCAIMLPANDPDPDVRNDNIRFLAALATVLEGPLVAVSAAGDDASWKTWGADHGGRIYVYDTPVGTELSIYAQFDDGYWLRVSFNPQSYEWTDYDPR